MIDPEVAAANSANTKVWNVHIAKFMHVALKFW